MWEEPAIGNIKYESWPAVAVINVGIKCTPGRRLKKKTSGFFNDRSRSCPLYDTNVSKLFFDVCASLTCMLYVSGFGDEIHGSFRPSPPPQIDLWRAAQVLARKCHPKVEIEKNKTGLTTNWRRRFERGPRSARTKSTEATAAESWSR